VLASVHSPIAFIHGDQQHDIAYPASFANARAIKGVPVFEGWQDYMTHIGTYGQPNGGFFGKLAVDWLDWRLKGSAQAAKTFKDADCLLCKAPAWHLFKQHID
jgi:hypothetical protein